MISFHAPDRPRLANGLPCWLGSRIALPSVNLTIEPRPEGSGWPRWTVLIMVGGRSGSSWAIRELDHPDVLQLLYAWEESPEKALQRWFNREPPSGSRRGLLIEDELAAGPGTNKTAEELGL